MIEVLEPSPARRPSGNATRKPADPGRRVVGGPTVLLNTAAAILGACVATLGVQVFAKGAAGHPMDALTGVEYAAVLSALKEENHIDPASHYPLITLEEPPKAEVLRWKPGEAIPRRALATIKKGPETFEAVVDLARKKVASWKQVEGVQPGILTTLEWTAAQKAVLADPRWRAAVRKRGLDDFKNVVPVPLTVGSYGLRKEESRRLVKVVCFDSRGTRNFWGRPIEGLIAVVDLDTRVVVELIDTGVVPIPKGPVDFDEDSIGKLREPVHPILIEQPRGPTFEVDGRVVGWQKWRFHFRVDPRLGLVVSMVRYHDDGRWRSILYQGSLSELFLPYMDPDVGWYFRTYMDAGEYGMGKLAARLEQNLDCPPNAVFFDAVFADDWGQAYTKERAACLFERYAGDIAWRHFEVENGLTEVRRRTELVLRLISTVGNYDYVFDWVFGQDGTIRVVVGSSGVVAVKAVRNRTVRDDQGGRGTVHGHMVAEHTLGVHHDHFFSFRIDLDVDGPENSFLIERLKTTRVGRGSPRKSVWVLDSRTAATERAAKLRIDIERPALWRVINSNVLGPLGYPVSYQLRTRANAVSLLRPNDSPQRRAGFTDYHLWVTPYDPRERYAAGAYPNQSKGGDGLPRWTSADRPIRETDIVLWYTLGFHHVVRAEDWPVLPTTWSEFELRPFDFFHRNPALDLPKRAEDG